MGNTELYSATMEFLSLIDLDSPSLEQKKTSVSLMRELFNYSDMELVWDFNRELKEVIQTNKKATLKMYLGNSYNLSELVNSAFIWDNTEKGQDYWQRVYSHLENLPRS